MTTEFTVDGVTRTEAAQRIQEALSDKYDTFVQMISGTTRVRVRSSSKTVEVYDTPSGVRIEPDLGSMADNSIVRQEFEQPRRTRDTQTQDTVQTTNELGQVHKPFSHEEAEYVPPAQQRTSDKKCKNCAHYDNHGNCHIVPDIDPEGHCENFYADVGFYANGSQLPNELSELNLTIWGDRSDARLEGSSPAAILADIEEAFEERFDQRDIQM